MTVSKVPGIGLGIGDKMVNKNKCSVCPERIYSLVGAADRLINLLHYESKITEIRALGKKQQQHDSMTAF